MKNVLTILIIAGASYMSYRRGVVTGIKKTMEIWDEVAEESAANRQRERLQRRYSEAFIDRSMKEDM